MILIYIIKKLYKMNFDNNAKFQEYIETESLETLHKLKLIADRQYYCGEICNLEDFQYDMLKETLLRRDANYVAPVGYKIREGENRVELPYWLGSMNKIKLENTRDFERWINKNQCIEYIIQDKLDGVSCLLVVKNKKVKLYTRGDGEVGADISYLSKYFKTVPKNIENDIAIRGELIMKKEVFDKKYSDTYSNARNMVAGRLGGKTIRNGLTDIEFIAYEIVDFDLDLDPMCQLEYLKNIGFTIVNYDVVQNISLETLSKIFFDFKKISEYEIDGIIVQSNKYNKRNTSGNPDYAFAFKMQVEENSVITDVLDVEWNISKWGILKPRISIKPISLGGVIISYSSGFNAKYINENKIGPGAVVRITRSGDVIPYITDVISQADKPSMPDISYVWNDTGVDIFTEERGEIPEVKRIASFFSSMGIKHVSEATVSKMYDHGLVTLLDILSATKDELKQIEGFQERLAERTYENIHNGLQNIKLPVILGASGIFGFGFGIKKIETLFSSIPDLLTVYKNYTIDEMYTKIMEVDGFSEKSAKKIANSLESADMFIKSLLPFVSFQSEKISSSEILKGKKFVLSGFRDKDLEIKIINMKGKVVTTVSNNTDIVIVKKIDENPSEKVKKALALNKEVLTKEDFVKKYF